MHSALSPYLTRPWLQLVTVTQPSTCPDLTPAYKANDPSVYGQAYVAMQFNCSGTYTLAIRHPAQYSVINGGAASYTVQVQTCCCS
jgi:hypothetical protein